MVSRSRTSRVARVQKGLTCPIWHIEVNILKKSIAMNDQILTPSWNRAKQKVRDFHRWHWPTWTSNWKRLGSTSGARLIFHRVIRKYQFSENSLWHGTIDSYCKWGIMISQACSKAVNTTALRENVWRNEDSRADWLLWTMRHRLVYLYGIGFTYPSGGRSTGQKSNEYWWSPAMTVNHRVAVYSHCQKWKYSIFASIHNQPSPASI